MVMNAKELFFLNAKNYEQKYAALCCQKSNQNEKWE